MKDALAALARHAGVFARYTDQTGQIRRTAPETTRALLQAMGLAAGTDDEARRALKEAKAHKAARVVPQWVVAEAGAEPELQVGGNWVLDLEERTCLEGRGPLPAMPLGRHRLTAGDQTCWVLSAPKCLPAPSRGWGITVPFYGIRGASHGGLADYGDLAVAALGLGKAGAGFIGLNPVHAGFSDPEMISPYAPSHRRRLSTAHLSVPGEATVPATSLLDYPASLSARRAALAAEWTKVRSDDPGFAAFRAREGAPLERFAIYEALSERHGPTWDAWPAPYRSPANDRVRSFAAAYPERVLFHQWLQYLADNQLATAARAARDGGMAHGLYLDLAVGTHPFGAETWAERGVFAPGVSLGAPPDAFSESGQVWNLAPFSPRALANDGFGALAATLRAQLRHAGMLRIDHILGFERAFWVPDNGAPGTYVRMPKAAMLAVLRIEAARAGAVIVGEDLGNIPAGLGSDLAASGVLGCQVAMFEGARRGAVYREKALASFGTHDLPTWTGWQEGRDIDARVAAGAMTAEAAEHAKKERMAEVSALLSRLEDQSVDALHRFLARSRSRLVAVQAEDALGLADQANLPGTVTGHPNWRRVLPVAAEALGTDPGIARAAEIMAEVGR